MIVPTHYDNFFAPLGRAQTFTRGIRLTELLSPPPEGIRWLVSTLWQLGSFGVIAASWRGVTENVGAAPAYARRPASVCRLPVRRAAGIDVLEWAPFFLVGHGPVVACS